MRQNPLRVLVADDEKLIADTLVQIFSQQGFMSLAVYDGESAVEAASAFHPNVLLADVMMPGMNGFELAQEYARAIPACRVILFSGRGDVVGMREDAGLEESSFDVYTKPVAPHVLLNRLRIEQDLLA
jgi:DNA-binding response OmpR family regulator